MSEKTPLYIKDVIIEDFKCFKGKNVFSFADEKGDWCRWTVLLGNNNTGKTNLLKAIASLTAAFESGFKGNAALVYAKTLLSVNNYKVDIVPYRSKYDIGYATDAVQFLSIYGYGVFRNIESKGIKAEGKKDNAENLIFNSYLMNFEDWLFQLDYAAKNNQEKAAQRRDLLKKVLTSEIFPEINDIRFISDEKLNNYIEFQTEDGWHKLSELGYGYQATLSWMCDFCKKMFERYPDSINPLINPAVLLIDELDLHLHPQWQREIVGYLSNIFTATQFIVTTHSPFILQSMDNVNLYTLQREGDHTLVEHHGSNRSFVGWRIEEILSEIMGLNENIQTNTYQKLMKQFDEALDKEDYPKGKEAFEALNKILHPQNAEQKLLSIQFSQLVPDDKT